MNNKNVKQFSKFAIVGVINTILDWGIFFILTHLIVTAKSFEPKAKAISFLITLINAFILHSKWTFKDEFNDAVGGERKVLNKKHVLFFKFFVVCLVGWGINYFVFKYTRLQLEKSQIISLVAASGSGILWNFFINKLWTFK